MAWVGIAAAALSAVSSLKGGMDQQAHADYQAKAAKAEGEQAALDATEQAARIRDRVRRTLGTGRVITAASGVDVNDGSAVDAAADVRAQGELDALTALWQGDIAKRRGASQSGLLNTAGNQAMKAGGVGFGTSVLGGLDKWYRRAGYDSSGGSVGNSGAFQGVGGQPY